MSRLASFGRFWWDFVVGDDWRAAIGIALAIGITAAIGSWWVLPPAVAVVLALSLRREAAITSPRREERSASRDFASR